NPSYNKLAESGEIFTSRQDENILSHIRVKDCINASSLVSSTTDDMAEVRSKFRNSDQNTMAVVDSDNHFWGILNRHNLRPYLLGKKSTHETIVSILSISPSFIVSPNDSVMQVIKMFDEADVWQLPVLDEERKFHGFASRSMILNNYRKLLKHYSE